MKKALGNIRGQIRNFLPELSIKLLFARLKHFRKFNIPLKFLHLFNILWLVISVNL